MKQKTIPTTPLERGAITTKTAAKAGGKTLKFLAQKPFLNQKKKDHKQEILNSEVGQIVFDGLSKLRGTALKIAQMVSLEVDILPPEIAKKLAQSHYQVPPLNKALVRKVIEGEFKKPLEEVFAEFDLEAFAAASLGQVHKAKLPSGETVAVKVQYPGIKRTIESDIKLAKSLILPLLKTKISKKYLDNVIEELSQRLKEETDYLGEADRGEWFAKNNSHPDIVIPTPFREYCGKRILTTEFIEGYHLDEWIKAKPTQEMINQACQALVEFHYMSILVEHRLHCDPNPGNYLFLEDGRIAIIDFGCVKHYSDEAMRPLEKAIRANIAGEKEKVVDGLAELGVDLSTPERREVFEKYLYPFTKIFSRPYRYDVFDFKEHSTFMKEFTESMINAVKAGHSLANFTPETIHIDRTYHGLFRIFHALGAEVRFKVLPELEAKRA